MENFQSVLEQELNISRKLDGVIISARDWRVFKFHFHFELFKDIYIDFAYPTKFKGMMSASVDQKYIEIRLGRYNSYMVAFLAQIRNENEVNFKQASTEIRSLAGCVVNAMKNTSTWADWRAKPDDSERRVIFMDDVVTFGNRFQKRVRDYIVRHVGAVQNFKLVIYALGQDCRFENVNRIKDNVHLAHVDSLIIHHALDFKKEGQMLMFHRKDLVQLLGRRQLSQEYYVCLLKEVGNFYFSTPTEETRDLTVVEAKFYNEALKQFHRGFGSLPFGYPQICLNLYSPAEFSFGFIKRRNIDWHKYSKQISALKRIVTDIGAQVDSLSARFEVIMNVNPTVASIRKLEEYMDQHPKFRTRKIIKCLKGIPIQRIRDHLQQNLLPFIDTLDQYVTNRMNAVINKSMEQFTPGKQMDRTRNEGWVVGKQINNI
jgi:hypothetical protein